MIDKTGKVVASGSKEHQPFLSLRPGWAEQDPGDGWRACGLAVQKALDSSLDSRRLDADEID